MKKLSPKEVRICAQLLARAEFPLPQALFDAWVENLPHVAIELAVLRECEQEKKTPVVEIFLTRRPSTDPFWPNMWHMPGTILRQNERVSRALGRLINTELGLLSTNFEPACFRKVFEFVRGHRFNESARGHEIGLLHILKIPSNCACTGGKFFSLKHLPQDIIPFHRLMTLELKRGKVE
ncbi:MAG: hypothetical protein A2664_00690 [Candidatus Taylorbacteria bacterium RIFCSPHIGHO2_01_FULL_46_22b]|uniref:Nudix hydrolase domain-containing protein n=1 Tax=Candidatus Taylorbacteria bacterium RIFCSPHIGHO2_01_FULL_46_22b TaxID=1802301 RepID=A0A1G2M3G4_9BACT|nr:MAG: hypothetical protein A2664_00690 [Candidatus Taylorbacteria bacterium RIFCSPHIGHO2_01_FULL_46_22b]